jgi:CRISPR-associated protein Cmr6
MSQKIQPKAKEEGPNIMQTLIKIFIEKYKEEFNKGLKKPTSYNNFNSDSNINKQLQNIFDSARNELKREIVERLLHFDFGPKITTANEYINEVVESLAQAGFDVVDVRAKISTKMLSGSAVGYLAVMLEVGMYWDPILDLPYVPGSSIKGIMRGNLLELCHRAAGSNGASKAERCTRAVLTLFGSGDRLLETNYLNLSSFKTASHVGVLGVFNVYPIALADGKLLDGDIVNSHYYRNNKVVRNEYEVIPNPVINLVVRSGVTFRFVIGVGDVPDASELASDIFGESIKGKVRDGVGLALLSLAYALGRGVGARTSKGYGIFDVDINGIAVHTRKGCRER